MKTPALVARATRRMAEAADYTLPITVKCRLGVDTDDSYESLRAFVDTVAAGGGVRHFSIHARAAILGGLSPAQNRSIPPLRYGHVYRLAAERPDLVVTLNGGVKGLAAAATHMDAGAAGVMVGREVMDRPWHALVGVDAGVYGEGATPPASRREILAAYVGYAEAEVAGGAPIRALVKPLLGLFAGEANGKRWRRALDTGLLQKLGVRALLESGTAVLSDAVLDRRTAAVPPPVRMVSGGGGGGGGRASMRKRRPARCRKRRRLRCRRPPWRRRRRQLYWWPSRTFHCYHRRDRLGQGRQRGRCLVVSRVRPVRGRTSMVRQTLLHACGDCMSTCDQTDAPGPTGHRANSQTRNREGVCPLPSRRLRTAYPLSGRLHQVPCKAGAERNKQPRSVPPQKVRRASASEKKPHRQ
ncbi:hypothetical protein BU14_0465s0006 [Porphyra umbilicalis]|uniref:DUS-like FMN-binding domain-containing protein n=1 Tax=Porphyra umbilicalis TaxID=2786 RepID=A0A1X6NU76_PORUM|nr:hypothetical protein BU14_0465s0006 [Porphyra umbilicalis]|eukprot:OSX72115.1 hypothetical protein BU14_0465s0006 [Porphyra umbilicalis]